MWPGTARSRLLRLVSIYLILPVVEVEIIWGSCSCVVVVIRRELSSSFGKGPPSQILPCCYSYWGFRFLTRENRYSEFDELRERLIETFPRSRVSIPALPPKSVVCTCFTSPALVDSRRI